MKKPISGIIQDVYWGGEFRGGKRGLVAGTPFVAAVALNKGHQSRCG